MKLLRRRHSMLQMNEINLIHNLDDTCLDQIIGGEGGSKVGDAIKNKSHIYDDDTKDTSSNSGTNEENVVSSDNDTKRALMNASLFKKSTSCINFHLMDEQEKDQSIPHLLSTNSQKIEQNDHTNDRCNDRSKSLIVGQLERNHIIAAADDDNDYGLGLSDDDDSNDIGTSQHSYNIFLPPPPDYKNKKNDNEEENNADMDNSRHSYNIFLPPPPDDNDKNKKKDYEEENDADMDISRHSYNIFLPPPDCNDDTTRCKSNREIERVSANCSLDNSSHSYEINIFLPSTSSKPRKLQNDETSESTNNSNNGNKTAAKKILRRPSYSNLLNMDGINNDNNGSTNQEQTDDSEAKPRMKRNISFSNLEIRVYDVTVGDNPACSTGVPLSLDWKYQSEEVVALEEYEVNREPRRNMNQLAMTNLNRFMILQQMGYSLGDIQKAIVETAKVKDERKKTRKEVLDERKKSREGVLSDKSESKIKTMFKMFRKK